MKTLLLSVAIGLSFGFQAQLSNFTVGQTAPNFTVTDLHGHTHQLSDYAGKWVIIDFYAYWCGPCAAIAPTINEFYRKYGCNNYDIVVLGIEGDGTTAQTQTFEDTNGGSAEYPTPNVSGLNGGGDAVHNQYGASAYPTIVLIGADGKFKNIDIWPISSVATIENAVSSNGGSAALVVRSCSSTADLQEMEMTQNSIYPNPSQGNLNFKISSPVNTELELNVYSIQGQKLASIPNQKVIAGENDLVFDMNLLSEGHYFLESKSKEGFSVRTSFQIVK